MICKSISPNIYIAGSTQKFVTVTGDQLYYADYEERSDEVNLVAQRYMERKQKSNENHNVSLPTATLSISDAELLEKMKQAKNGAEFTALWSGDISGYPSHSEADLALCNKLAFWTGRNAEQIDRLFRQSGLMRPKWNRQDYRTDTIERAIKSCQDVYSPQSFHKAIEKSQDSSKSKGRPRKEELTLDILREYLTSNGLTVRWNVLSHELEFGGVPSVLNPENIANDFPVFVHDALKTRYTGSLQTVCQYLTLIGGQSQNRYNPVLDYIKAEAWDGHDYQSDLIRIIGIKDDKL